MLYSAELWPQYVTKGKVGSSTSQILAMNTRQYLKRQRLTRVSEGEDSSTEIGTCYQGKKTGLSTSRGWMTVDLRNKSCKANTIKRKPGRARKNWIDTE